MKELRDRLDGLLSALGEVEAEFGVSELSERDHVTAQLAVEDAEDSLTILRKLCDDGT